MIYGLIIAAGKQSRFNSRIPKCLSKIDNKCILDSSIDNLSQYCDAVYITCSIDCLSFFSDYDNIISIESGKGSGDAILKSIAYIIDNNNVSDDDFIIIQWGDALVNKQVYSILLNNKYNTCTIPCTVEKNPYVQILKDDRSVKVKFSKYGDSIEEGYHDMCVFMCNIKYLYDYLKQFNNKYYFNGLYNHKHGNEFEFLDVFNDTNCLANIIEVSDNLVTKSFNTIDELKQLGGLI